MIRIKCINPNCIAPQGKFPWDDRAHAGGGPAKPGEPEAVAFFADCPYCGTENKIWLKKVKKNSNVVRGV